MRRPFHQTVVRCAAEGCCEPVTKFRWYCKGHYYSLPSALRGRLWASWRAAMECNRKPLPTEEQLRRNRAYQAAFQACQEHLRTVRPTSAEAMTTVAYAPDGEEVRYVGGRVL